MAETEELAENDPGGPGEVVQMQDESEKGKGLSGGKHQGPEPEMWIPPSRMSLLLGRLMWLKRRNLQNTIQVNQRGTRTTHSRV